ncbi:MAG: hypothetical protein ACMXYB_04555 [Candidatus Woesearchaeota archaeon]
MFEFQCMQYLKELELTPQNEDLRNSLKLLLQQNSSKVDYFITSFNLSSNQKEILLELLQEKNVQGNSFNSNFQTQPLNFVSQNNYNNSAIQQVKNQDEFLNKTMDFFNNWKEEYFKLRNVSPKCIEIGQQFIQLVLVVDDLYSTEFINVFTSLSSGGNDAFEKFKNHIINLIIAELIEIIDSELVIIKTSKIPFISKYLLIFKLEILQKKFAKRQLQYLERLYDLLDESYALRGGGSN